MWLRRQDELNESRPTERFSTAIRLLSGRAGMERRYAKDLRARSTEEGEHNPAPDGVTDSVDVRAFAMPPTGQQARARVEPEGTVRREPGAQGASASGAPSQATAPERAAKGVSAPEPKSARPSAGKAVPRARTTASSAEAMARARRMKALARRRR